MRKSKISREVKIDYVNKYINGEISVKDICGKLGVNKSTVRAWIKSYKTFGASNIDSGATNSKYSRETKLGAVKDYIDEKLSLNDITVK